MRHRVGLGEGALLVAALICVAVVALLFELDGTLSSDQSIELTELVILGILFVSAFVFFGWRRFAEQEREIRLRREAEDRAEFLANHDHLTGLPNRRELERALRDATSIAPSAAHGHAILALDLNGFKKVNDLFGHPRGDEVLGIVARRLKAALREGDTLARIGGDEFAIVARDVSGAEGAINLAHRILRGLEAPIVVGPDRHPVGTGIGIALVPKDGTDGGDLLRKADVALYKAKNAGGSGFAFFQDEMDREARERDSLERDLASAIGTDALRPHYQPIVDLRSGEIKEFEALARWTHPTLGNIPPERFIPIAEDSELIRGLTDYLLARACKDALQWPAQVSLSFNISPALLRDATFGLRTLGIVSASKLPLQRLKLEITENALVRDFDAARSTLGALREAGIRIALDDFGTGATSLFHLRSFKFDEIKIDRSFIERMNTEKESGAIVRALVGLGVGLGVNVVAEGVEQADQRASLTQDGCSVAQGFLFSEAVSADAAARLVARAAVAKAG